MQVEGEIAVVRTSRGRKIFWFWCVKLLINSINDESETVKIETVMIVYDS